MTHELQLAPAAPPANPYLLCFATHANASCRKPFLLILIQTPRGVWVPVLVAPSTLFCSFPHSFAARRNSSPYFSASSAHLAKTRGSHQFLPPQTRILRPRAMPITPHNKKPSRVFIPLYDGNGYDGDVRTTPHIAPALLRSQLIRQIMGAIPAALQERGGKAQS